MAQIEEMEYSHLSEHVSAKDRATANPQLCYKLKRTK